MFVLSRDGEYEAQFNDIRFVCETVEDDFEEMAVKIAEVYEDRLEQIAGFMLEEGITDFFGELTEEKIIASLGAPTIDLGRGLVTYLEHTFDQEHIIEFEFDGILDELFYLNIDG